MFVSIFGNFNFVCYLVTPRVIAWCLVSKSALEPKHLTEILLFWATLTLSFCLFASIALYARAHSAFRLYVISSKTCLGTTKRLSLWYFTGYLSCAQVGKWAHSFLSRVKSNSIDSPFQNISLVIPEEAITHDHINIAWLLLDIGPGITRY